MAENANRTRSSSVLQNKRDATRYQILVQIAERQPAVSQQEIADTIGITAQAVSDYLQGLVKQGFVQKHGRGRYEVSKGRCRLDYLPNRQPPRIRPTRLRGRHRSRRNRNRDRDRANRRG